MPGEPQAFGSGWLSAVSDTVARMFESYELPDPEDIVALDDAGLINTVVMTTVLEDLVTACRALALDELCIRRTHPQARTRPTPPRPRAIASSSRRRRRKARKRRRRH
jgi:hypothetical protein